MFFNRKFLFKKSLYGSHYLYGMNFILIFLFYHNFIPVYEIWDQEQYEKIMYDQKLSQ